MLSTKSNLFFLIAVITVAGFGEFASGRGIQPSLSAGKVARGGVTPDPALKGASIIGPVDNYTCIANGAWPHETECVLYYDCWDGQASIGICTENMLFDVRYDGCNYASAVNCGNLIRPPGYPSTATPPGTVPTTTPPSGSTPPGNNFTCTENGAFPHPYCDYYWTCYETEQTLHRCQGGQLYDLRYKGCNFPELTGCQDRVRPETAPGTTTPDSLWTPTPTTTTESGVTSPPGGEFTCTNLADGNYSDPEDCSGFYICMNGAIIGHQVCPDGLYFNPIINNCDFPWNVDCPNAHH